MTDEQAEPGSWRTASDTDRTWTARHGGGYPPGWYVRFRHRVHAGRVRAGSCTTPAWHEHGGTVAGRSLRDEHTSTTWVPVRPHNAADDVAISLVRATDILDARPPLLGEQAWN